jgi:hypothetical protein
MTRVVWADPVRDLFYDLSKRERGAILERVKHLKRFPHMYPVRPRGRFRRHRWFQSGTWLVFYKVASGTVYIRAMWPARIP